MRPAHRRQAGCRIADSAATDAGIRQARRCVGCRRPPPAASTAGQAAPLALREAASPSPLSSTRLNSSGCCPWPSPAKVLAALRLAVQPLRRAPSARETLADPARRWRSYPRHGERLLAPPPTSGSTRTPSRSRARRRTPRPTRHPRRDRGLRRAAPEPHAHDVVAPGSTSSPLPRSRCCTCSAVARRTRRSLRDLSPRRRSRRTWRMSW